MKTTKDEFAGGSGIQFVTRKRKFGGVVKLLDATVRRTSNDGFIE